MGQDPKMPGFGRTTQRHAGALAPAGEGVSATADELAARLRAENPASRKRDLEYRIPGIVEPETAGPVSGPSAPS